jgi:hypothetical protein
MKPRTEPPTEPIPDAELEQLLRDSRQLEDAPDPVLRRAFAIWKPRARAASPWRRLLAVLSFDSDAAPGLAPALAFGVRSAGGTRQLLYAVDGRDIDLRIVPAGGAGWRLLGQVLGPDLAGRVQVRVGGTELQATLDELAEFKVEPVPPGECHVELELGETVLELPVFTLPER